MEVDDEGLSKYAVMVVAVCCHGLAFISEDYFGNLLHDKLNFGKIDNGLL